MLKLYNTLTRQKEEFQPIDASNIRMYVCGPTVYDYAHIGNARPVVVFDVLYRVLRHLHGNNHVKYVRNITDVDDKIMAKAKETGESIGSLTKRTEQQFKDDMAQLGALDPDVQPRATEHIAEMIALNEKLIANNHAYVAEGHVLFHTPSMKNYGALSGRNRDDQIAGARVDVAPYKKDPADFVLWKPSSADQIGWDSPWSRGRPGWHIECSAMAEKHLGQTFDIHGGGLDLIFPHHENEIAQSCCAHNIDRLANVWMHNGFLTVNGEKMSKSLGNFYTVHDLLEKWPGEVIRYALLSAHYRQPLDFTDELLQQSKQALDRLYGALRDTLPKSLSPGATREGERPGEGVDRNAQTIAPSPNLSPNSASLHGGEELILNKLGLLDDLNTAQAFSYLHELAGETNRTRDPAKAAELKTYANLLGFLNVDSNAWFQNSTQNKISVEDIENLITQRNEARAQKDFKTSDQIRDDLLKQGIVLDDTAQGTRWRFQ